MKQMINRIREKIRHSQLGSATIEAVVAFTGFLFVIFTILNIVNLCRAQMLISNAMDTVTKELTQYSYFYEISGLQKFENKLQAISENGDLDLNTIASSVGNLYTALSDGASSSEAEMRGLANSLQEGTLSSSSVSTALQNIDTEKNEVLAAMESMEAQMEGLLDNPVAYLKSIVAVAGSQGLETLKSRAIAAPLAKSLMVKHFGNNRAEANASLERLGVVDGLNGMNFNMSTIFQKNHKDEIHLVVYYKVKVVQLFKWADFEATICKETRARAWLGGDDVQCMVVSTISASESTGGDETRGIGETSSVEGDDEEGSGDDEDSDSHTGDTGLEEYLASVGQDTIEKIKQNNDTSGWTEEQWREAVNGLALGVVASTESTPKSITVTVKGVSYTLNDPADAWDLPPVIRGVVIEEVLAQEGMRYGGKDWTHCGSERGGYYPVIDYINKEEAKVVSLKTIDFNAPSYQGDKAKKRIISYYESYAKKELPVEGEYAKVLLIMVPEGTKGNIPSKEMNILIEEAAKLGVKLEVEEFKLK